MRVPAAHAIRVGPGDQVIIRGQLPVSGKLGRMFVFASVAGGSFAPYVKGEAELLVANGRPSMGTPVTFRLHEAQPVREVAFTADIDGFICVMQEIDTADEPRAKIKMTCRVNPDLNWRERLWRKMRQWQRPKSMS